MCAICDLASAGGGTSPIFASAAYAPRSAASINAKRSNAQTAARCRRASAPRAGGRLIKGGTILSMDERVGDHATGDVLIEGSTIAEIAPSISAPDAAVIDAAGHIVMPGFVDAHSHQFETALRSFLADGILINDGRPESAHNYYELILQKLSMGYRPQDVYINELFAGVAQIDAGVTAVMDISQIHHSP